MNLKELITGLVFFASALLGYAESKVLTSADGRVAEIMIDFKIEDVRVDRDDNVSLVATAKENGEAVGFSLIIGKPRLAEIPQEGKDTPLPVVEADLTLKSIGAPTTVLKTLLNRRLRRDEKDVPRWELAGVFRGYSSFFDSSVAQRAFFRTSDLGVGKDENGKSADCFSMVLVIDGPMERLTAYFSRPGGLGGSSSDFAPRHQWYLSRAKSGDDANRAAGQK